MKSQWSLGGLTWRELGGPHKNKQAAVPAVIFARGIRDEFTVLAMTYEI